MTGMVLLPGELSVQAELLLANLKDAAKDTFFPHAKLASLGATTDAYFELIESKDVFEYKVNGVTMVRAAHRKPGEISSLLGNVRRIHVGM